MDLGFAPQTPLDDHRDALAHADAHGGQRVAAAAALQLDAPRSSTRRAPLMPSGWPSAMAPPFGFTCSRVVGDAEVAQRGQHLRGEGLVQLDHVDVLRA